MNTYMSPHRFVVLQNPTKWSGIRCSSRRGGSTSVMDRKCHLVIRAGGFRIDFLDSPSYALFGLRMRLL